MSSYAEMIMRLRRAEKREACINDLVALALMGKEVKLISPNEESAKDILDEVRRRLARMGVKIK